jgi:hypothetical protein
MHDYFQRVIDWMETHDKLAGWAQTFGALIALVLAIAIPWWQRKEQLKDARVTALRLECHLTSLLCLLVGDTWSVSERIQSNPDPTPTELQVQLVYLEDLRIRINGLEPRLPDEMHLNALLGMRRCLMIFHRQLVCPEDSKTPISMQPAFLEFLAYLKEHMHVLDNDTQQLRYQLDWMLASWWRKPCLWWKHRFK